jgi:hypothetical protein
MAFATAAHANEKATTMDSRLPADRTRDDLVDGRDGRVVGDNDDNVLESIGKAVIAPLAGADEAAQALPQRSPATQAPNVPKP